MVSADWGQTVALSADSRDTSPKSADRHTGQRQFNAGRGQGQS